MTKQFFFKQFNLSYLFALCLKVKKFYLTHRLDQVMCYHSSQSELGSDVNEEIFRIPQNYRITGASPSDCLVPLNNL